MGAIIGFGCFSEVATVQVMGVSNPVAMKDLQVGDNIWTGNGYSPVYSFGHRSPRVNSEFLQIHTAAKTSPLEMTAEHLVFLEGKDSPVRADSLAAGDVLQGLVRMTVTKIQTVERQGLYAPLTPEGILLVDGVKTSSYISLQAGNSAVQLQNGISLLRMSQHDYIHAGLSPMRLLCMGISSSYCSTDNESGIPFYARLSIAVNEWINAKPVMVQAVAFASVLVLIGSSAAVETVFGPSLAPLALLLLGTIISLVIKKKKQQPSKPKLFEVLHQVSESK